MKIKSRNYIRISKRGNYQGGALKYRRTQHTTPVGSVTLFCQNLESLTASKMRVNETP